MSTDERAKRRAAINAEQDAALGVGMVPEADLRALAREWRAEADEKTEQMAAHECELECSRYWCPNDRKGAIATSLRACANRLEVALGDGGARCEMCFGPYAHLEWCTEYVEPEDDEPAEFERDLDAALQKARHYRMTPAEQEAQRRSFAYGNAAVDNPKVTRQMVDEAADRLAVERQSQPERCDVCDGTPHHTKRGACAYSPENEVADEARVRALMNRSVT